MKYKIMGKREENKEGVKETIRASALGCTNDQGSNKVGVPLALTHSPSTIKQNSSQ